MTEETETPVAEEDPVPAVETDDLSDPTESEASTTE
jgi:hypothetical protein